MNQPAVRVLADRYHLTERIGRGGMGAVWRARDELLGRDVAVKEILLPHGLDDDELAVVRGRALREARAAAHVRHPAVVTIHDVVIEDGHPWIVMDFVPSASLADRLEDTGALPVASVARIGVALAGALAAIHDEGVVHRDVKPANVLIGADGDVVLTDFGIATIEGDVRFTASGMLIGTPGYMAPERLSGEASGPPSDLWALGAVLYAAVEGHGPYTGGTPMVVASAVLTGEPAPMRRAGPLAPLITELLARDPAGRPDARRTEERLASPAAGDGRTEPPPAATRAEPRRGEGSGARPEATRREPAPPVRRAPVPAPEPPVPAVRRRLSPGRIAGAVVVLLLGVSVYWLATLPTGGGGPESAVDPCTLLTDGQVKQIAPGTRRTSMPPDCVWAGDIGAPHLTVSLKSFSNVRETTIALHEGEGRYASAPAVDVSLIGDEVFACTDLANDEVEVLFRHRKHLVQIGYNGADATEKAYAVQAARWADQSLGYLDE